MVIATVLIALFTGCGSNAANSTPLSGSVTVEYGELSDLRNVSITDIEQSRPCTGAQVGRGYEDIGPGTEVVVSDETNKVIATGQLGGGTWGDAGCRFEFSIDVPDADFYKVSVGRRGGGTISRQDVENKVPLDLTLGV